MVVAESSPAQGRDARNQVPPQPPRRSASEKRKARAEIGAGLICLRAHNGRANVEAREMRPASSRSRDFETEFETG